MSEVSDDDTLKEMFEDDLSQGKNNLLSEITSDKNFENIDVSHDSRSILKYREHRNSVSSDDEEENVVKPLYKDINNSQMFAVDEFCNSEKRSISSHSMDNSCNRSTYKFSDVESEMHEMHSNTEINSSSVNSASNRKRDSCELNYDIRLCVDKILENLDLAEEKSEQIDDFIVTKQEESESAKENLGTLTGTPERDNVKGNNKYVIFRVSPDKIAEIFTEPLNVNKKTLGKKNEPVSIDHQMVDQKGRLTAEFTKENIENSEDNINDGNGPLINEFVGSFDDSCDSATIDVNKKDILINLDTVKNEELNDISIKDKGISNQDIVHINLEDDDEISDEVISDKSNEDISIIDYEIQKQNSNCKVGDKPEPQKQNTEISKFSQQIAYAKKFLKIIEDADSLVDTLVPILSKAEEDEELNSSDFIVKKQKSEEISAESNHCESVEENKTNRSNMHAELDNTNGPKDFSAALETVIDLKKVHRNAEQRDCDNTSDKKNGTSICNETIGINTKVNEIGDDARSCLDTVLEGPNLVARGNRQTNDCSLSNKETGHLESDVHSSKNQLKMLNKELMKITKRKSKLKNTCVDDSDVIIVFDNEEKNNDHKTVLAENFKICNETEKYAGAQSYEKFHEELDYELKILKAQYSDIQDKLLKAKKIFSAEKVNDFISKINKELTSYMQSLEELRIKFTSKLVHAEPKIFDEEGKAFSSFYRQQYYEEKNVENLNRHGSLDCTTSTKKSHTLYGKVESHQNFEYGSEMSSKGMFKTSRKYKEKSEQKSNSEKEICKSIHKHKFKLSHYSYEHNLQPSSKEKIGKCKFKKEPKLQSHSCDCGAKVGGFSKSFIEHRKLKISKSSPKNSLLKPCCRRKICESRYVRKFKLSKERYLSTDSSDSSDISSFSDEEFPAIRTDPKRYHGCSKYLKTITSVSQLVKEASNASKKERLGKRMRESSYESDVISIFSSDDGSVDEIQSVLVKNSNKEKSNKQYIENKRDDSLIDRKRDFINKYTSKNGDLVPASLTALTPVEKGQESYSDQEEARNEINTSKAMIPILEFGKKRKKKTSEKTQIPFKLAKFSSHSDVHHFSKDKYSTKSPGRKLKSSVILPSTSSSSIKTERLSPCKLVETKYQDHTMKNKHGTENRAKLQSSVLAICSDISRSLEEKGTSKNAKKSGYCSSPTSDDQIEVPNQMKFRNFDQKCSKKMFRDLAPEYNKNEKKSRYPSTMTIDEQKEEESQMKFRNFGKKCCKKMFKDVAPECKNKGYPEIDDPKDMESCISFRKKKREPKYMADCVDKIQSTSKQQNTAEFKIQNSKNVSGKLKKKVGLTSEKKSLKDREESPVASSSLDLFKKLNKEILKTNKHKQIKPKMKNSNFNTERW